LNVSSLATSTFDPVLGQDISSPLPPPAASSTWICTCISASYFCYCQIICSKFVLCQLMLYNDGGGDMSSSDKGKAEPVLVSLSDSYLLFNLILVDASGLSSCSI